MFQIIFETDLFSLESSNDILQIHHNNMVEKELQFFPILGKEPKRVVWARNQVAFSAKFTNLMNFVLRLAAW